MMNRFVLLGFVLLCVIAQGLLRHLGLPALMIPQSVAVCVVFLAFYDRSALGAVMAFTAGLMLDLSSATLLGPWAGACVLVFAALAFLSQRLFVESVVVAMLVTALTAVVVGCVYILLALKYQAISGADVMMLVGQAIASALSAPLLIGIMRRLYRRPSVVALRRGSVTSTI